VSFLKLVWIDSNSVLVFYPEMVGVVCPSIVYFFDINIYHLTGETSSWVHHLLKAKIQR